MHELRISRDTVTQIIECAISNKIIASFGVK